MGGLAFVCAVFVFMLTLTLLDGPRRTLSARERRLRAIAESRTAYFNELDGSLYDRFLAPFLSGLRRRAARRRLKRAGKKRGNEKLEKQLRGAGALLSTGAFSLIKAVIVLGLAGGTALLLRQTEMDASLKPLLALLAAMLGWILPNYVLIMLAKARRESMRKQLPDMMDLLSVSIDAGLSFDLALKRALDRFTGALKEEMTVASMEIQMGKPRREALGDLSERCDIGEMKILIAAIVQSEQMGTPIKNVLKAQSAQLRAARKQAAQEKGMKAPVKMMLPMVAFVFPVMLIILMGPTVMNIVDYFK